jgi:two-component system, LytTR family, response regulator
VVAPIRTLLVDDEPLALAALRKHALGDPELNVVAECSSGVDAIQLIRKLEPELVLMDVHMPQAGGFEVLEELEEQQRPATVFITAYDEFAVRAFEMAAVDFLLKPFDGARFRLAIDRAKQKVRHARQQGPAESPALAAPLQGSTHQRTRYAERLLVNDRGHLFLLPVDSITWIEGERNYLRVHCQQASYRVRLKIGDMEEVLDPKVFARIHRSHIVNVERIVSLKSVVNGNYIVSMEDGTELRMSSTFSDSLLGTGSGVVMIRGRSVESRPTASESE